MMMKIAIWRPFYAIAVTAIVLWVVGRDMSFMHWTFVYDVFIYQCYARGFWQGPEQSIHDVSQTRACQGFWGTGARRFHTFPREYPAPALAVFSLPLLTPWLPYDAAFLWWMALLLLLATGVVAWRGPPAAAIAVPLYTLVAGWQFLLDRYDLVPGLDIMLALVLAQRRNARSATAVLAMSTLLKGLPALLFPALLIAWRRNEGRWRIDCIILFVSLLLAGLLPVLLTDATAFWSPVLFALWRDRLQVCSPSRRRYCLSRG
jgi:hypothetical protein